MIVIIHRVNTIERLKTISYEYGVEIDIRGYGDRILLNHEPIGDPSKCDELEEYLKNFHHAFVVFNVKEAGYEKQIVELARKYGIENYFFLDVEFSYLYVETRKNGVRKIAVRYSEAEPIESVEAQIVDGKPLLDWVWIDTNTQLPLNKEIVEKLKPIKTCLVCPERWGRPEDIPNYIKKMRSLNFIPDAVMTTGKYAEEWKRFDQSM